MNFFQQNLNLNLKKNEIAQSRLPSPTIQRMGGKRIKRAIKPDWSARVRAKVESHGSSRT